MKLTQYIKNDFMQALFSFKIFAISANHIMLQLYILIKALPGAQKSEFFLIRLVTIKPVFWIV